MPTAETTNPGKEEDQTQLAAQKTRIRAYVTKLLGNPVDLFKIRVHNVGSEAFRVNVWVGKSYTTARSPTASS